MLIKGNNICICRLFIIDIMTLFVDDLYVKER